MSTQSNKSKAQIAVGVIREFLMAASAVLFAWGLGTEALWQEVTGGLLAVFVLVWGIRVNVGIEALFSVIRKVLSAAAGVSIYHGWLSPEKATLLVGALMSGIAMVWTLGKSGLFNSDDDDGNPPQLPTFLLLVLCAASFLLLPSCASRYGELWVDHEGNLHAMVPYQVLKAPVVPAK